MTSLLDVLKETDLRVGLQREDFKSVARETFRPSHVAEALATMPLWVGNKTLVSSERGDT